MKSKMTCDEFFDQLYDDHDLSTWFDEMYWEQSFNSDKVFEDMVQTAKTMGIELTDIEDWDYDKIIYNAYDCTEKGLS